MLVLLGLVMGCLLTGCATELPRRQADPWVGTYLKYPGSDFIVNRTGLFNKPGTITIAKDSKGYKLLGGYENWHFKEVKEGVLSDSKDGKGGLGTISLGTMEYADGKKVSILRVDFCYEIFVLSRDRLREHERPVHVPAEASKPSQANLPKT